MDQKVQYVIELLKQGQGAQQAAREIEQVDAAQKKASASAASMASSFKSLYATVAGSFIAREVLKFASDSIKAFEDQERAIQKLEGSLRSAGQFSQEYSRSLQRQAEALQELTNVGDDTIEGVQSQLILFGAQRDDMERLTTAVLNLSAGLGTDLNAAALLVGKALQGEFSSLSRYGIQVDETATRAQKLEQVLSTLEQRFGGLAAATAEQGTGLKGLSTAFGDFKESAGALIADVLSPAIREATDVLKSLTVQLGAVRGITGGPGSGLKGAANTALTFLNPAGIGSLVGQMMAGNFLGTDAVAAMQKRFEESEARRAKGGTPPNAIANRLDAALAKQQMDDLTRALALESARNFFAPAGAGMTGTPIRPSDLLRGQSDARANLLGQQADAGIISETDYQNQLKELVNAYDVSLAQMADKGYQVVRENRAALKSDRDQELADMADGFNQQRNMVDAFYAYRKEMAAGNAEAEADIEREHLATLQDLQTLHQREIFRTSALFTDVLQPAAQQFAAGFSGAIVNSFKDGGKAFQQFAAQFMQQIAQMILQTIILRTIMSAFGFGVGAIGGGGGLNLAAGTKTFGRGGIQYAANGIQTVDQATWFPGFNVIAGEAGREMLTVLSRPSTFAMGGFQGVQGWVEGQNLSIVPSQMLGRAPTMAANGTVQGGGSFTAGPLQGGGGGQSVVIIRMEPGLRAEIREEAISGAVLRVENDLNSDTSMAAAVKGLTA